MPMVCFDYSYFCDKSRIYAALENHKRVIDQGIDVFNEKVKQDNKNTEWIHENIVEICKTINDRFSDVNDQLAEDLKVINDLKSRIERLEKCEKDYGMAHANDMNEVEDYMALHDSYLKDIRHKQEQFQTTLNMLAPFQKATVDEILNIKTRLKVIEPEVLGLHLNTRITALTNRINTLENQNVKEKTD